ncbi:iron chelate uptake ABC transporter family permease subunit [Streptomyces sp. NPDC056500]|uniref:iron chelate uptake ABC transporter family permease subunit n=1 Tax=Streptomyces sp. NPDC056500 TaxID=3345840 RepID=UPI0036A33816
MTTEGRNRAARESPRPGVAPTAARRSLWLLLAVAVLLAMLLLSVGVGSKYLPPATVWDGLFHYTGSNDHVIIRDLRLPRTLLGLLVGMALGVAGAVIQALSRNPLADPGILGVNAGAGFAAVLAIALLGLTDLRQYIWFAFLGAVLATIAVYAIGSRGRGGATPIRLTLAGVATGAVLSGISSGITLLDPKTFDRMRFWAAGSIAGQDMQTVARIAPFLVGGLLLALTLARPLNAVALGTDTARALGVNINRTRLLSLVALTLLCGGATAVAGPIAFIGLMIPHVARWIVGPDQRWILPYTLVLSPILLLSSDIIGRLVLRPGELQVGIVTAFVGVPVLIALVRQQKASGL